MKKLLFACLFGFFVVLAGCKSEKDCGDETTQNNVVNIVNTNLCQDCVSGLNSIRMTEFNKDTGATTCQANMVVARGVFTGERNVYYRLEDSTEGEQLVTVFGVPMYFNMSGK